jgi:hypothetical protein
LIPERLAARLFAVDLRSLALVRMGVAALLLLDLGLRARDFSAHYSDAGILPRAELAASETGRLLAALSLHAASGSAAWQAALFAVAAAAALALLVGWHSRAAALLAWALLASLQNRNPLLVYGGDNVLVLLLFWMLFLPVGARASLDARAGRVPRARTALSVGSAGLLVQVAALHWFSALHKRGAEWFPDGSALFYALHVDKWARPAALLLREHASLLRLLTYGTLVLELGIPLLLFSPWRTSRLRLLGVASLVAFHAGIFLTMDLVLFSWISACAACAFLPGSFWDRLAAARGGGRGALPAGTLGLSRRANAAAAAALGFVLAWNVLTLRRDWRAVLEAHPLLAAAAFPGLALRLGQTWFMFAPHPPRATVWHAVRGVRPDGSAVDCLFERAGEPAAGKPAARAGYYPSGRWERVFANAPQSEHGDAWPALGRYFCRRALAAPGLRGPLAEVEIWRRSEATRPDGSRGPVTTRRVLRHPCAEPSGTLPP